MSNQNQNESTADMVVRISKTEVHQRILRARQNFLPIVGTGKGAFKDPQTGEMNTLATKGDIKKATHQALTDEGLVGYFSQCPERNTTEDICFEYKLIHADTGQSYSWYISLPKAKGTFWDYGSAQTYAYRYLVGDVLNLIIVDSLEEVDQDGVQAQLSQQYNTMKKELLSCTTFKDVESCLDTHKSFTDYIKKYNEIEYIKMVAKQINLINMKIGDK